ncbi:MAG: GTPase [Nocardioidaceae bacterium]
MSSLVDVVRKAVGRGTDLGVRVEGLARAVDAAKGRLPDELVSDSWGVVEHAGQRLRLSGDHTVVALAGATGSGKSSLFNALCGIDLAAIGLKRPTTSWALACAWGSEGATDLLDWVGIPRRHQVSRGSLLDTAGHEGGATGDAALSGLVLLDLPDHDSTEVSHHLEVDRLVQVADLLVWVLDPQKYADAAIHNRYLKPMASHSDVIMVVLNHFDEVPEAQQKPFLADVRRLLADDGLAEVPLLATSATRGDGIEDLRKQLIRRVQQKHMARDRLLADVESAAAGLRAVTGHARPADVAKASKSALSDAFAEAAGVPVVVTAVERSTRNRAKQATGWPVTKWASRFRPDPLKRLHLDLGSRDKSSDSAPLDGAALGGAARTSLPQATEVQRARVDMTVRSVASEATSALPQRWAVAVRHASVSRLDDIGDGLDRAVGETDLGVARRPRWWMVVQVLQWALFLTAVSGALWLVALAGFAYVRLPPPPTPQWLEIPLPVLLLVGGALSGVVLAVLARVLGIVSAKRKAAAVDHRLRTAIGEVVQDLVVEPIETEIEAYRACRDGVAVALGR